MKKIYIVVLILLLVGASSSWGASQIFNGVPRTESLTMAAGVITIPASNIALISVVTVDTSGGAAENLTGISGGIAGQIMIFQSANNARVPTIVDGGTLHIQANFALDDTTDNIVLLCTAANTWKELSRASNN